MTEELTCLRCGTLITEQNRGRTRNEPTGPSQPDPNIAADALCRDCFKAETRAQDE